MNVLNLENYIGRDWTDDVNYTRIINVVKARKFQPPNKIVLNPKPTDSLQMLCASRVSLCQGRYGCSRNYEHKSYEYDNMNELERFGAGKYARNYSLIISFEDSLDFVYSCIFKTKLGSLVEFCNEHGIDYTVYSREHLAGGTTGKELFLTDFFGFSPAFDVVINTIGSDDSIDRRLYFNRLISFCRDFRNALLVHTGLEYENNKSIILASAGVTSAVYYSDNKITGEVPVQYKMYKTNLKILCVEHGKYFDAVHENLCS